MDNCTVSEAGKDDDLELRYRTLYEQSPDGILIINSKGNFIDFNKAAHEMLGYNREEFSRLHISAVNVDSLEKIQACINRLLADGRVEFEARYRTKDESIRDVLVISRVITSSGKKYFHSIWKDITERKRTEEELRKSEAFIKSILDSVDEEFIVVGRDYRIQSVNRAFLTSVKRTREEVTGHYCYEISHGKDKPCHEYGEECCLRSAFETGMPGFATHTHHDRDGAPVYVEIKTYPLNDASGHISSVIEVMNNVTEKRKLEDQLRQAQKMEAIGQFAGGIAHDFNNILTAIIGYASIMKMKMNPADPLGAEVGQILDSAERASALTRGILSFSRKHVINQEPVDLSEILSKMENVLRSVMDENIHVQMRHCHERVTVMADISQLQQVVMNLAANAKDAMPRGGTFAITVEPFEMDHAFILEQGFGKPGSHVLVTLSDTGAGMDEKTKISIFEPFFTTKDAGKGTGLGLAIVYGIVKQHSGHITCASQPGMGTTFRIYLPAFKGPVSSRGPLPTPEARGGTETILISEDDEAIRRLLRQLLTEKGYRVIEAADGEETIEKFKSNMFSIDLLILDVMMPKKTGKEAYEKIRKERPGIKALFMSGYTADAIDQESIRNEGLNFISKPILPAELFIRIRDLLDGIKH